MAKETPPRAWGRRAGCSCRRTQNRNTPTGVGKTVQAIIDDVMGKKHPHGRGEDRRGVGDGWRVAETPPRAWGRLLGVNPTYLSAGNTPTGVGKTARQARADLGAQKHPHGRGEDRRRKYCWMGSLETPPRAWGRLLERLYRANPLGNTPTGVGKTQP